MNIKAIRPRLCVLAFLPIAAFAQSLPLTQDSYVVTSPASGANFGSTVTINVSNATTSNASHALVQFDLTALPAGTTAANISKATLSLFVKTVGATGTINVSMANGSWTESGVTGLNAPVPGTFVASGVAVSTASISTYLSLDATAAVQSWLNGTTNSGFIITPNDGVVGVAFDSKESTTTSHPATLTITLAVSGTAGPAGPQGPQGPQGVAGAQGPQGPAGAQGTAGAAGTNGAGYAATSTSTLAVGSGSMTFATQTGLAYTTGARARATSAANSANYMEGLVTSYSGASLIINVDTTGGSGTHADWNLNVAGNAGSQGPAGATGAQGPAGAAGAQGNAGPTGSQGPQGPAGAQGATGSAGPTGPGYGATSTSSLTIGSGSMTFATQTGLAYTTGARARATSAANSANYMEGLVTSYSGASLIINVDTTGGSGTHADWNLNVAGNAGSQGPAGATGAQGPAGAAGAQGNAGPTGSQGPQGPAGAQGATGSAGPTGPGYGATSTSSLTIGSGSMTFATQTGLAYTTGARARATSAANSANYMEGLVTSYSGASLIINVDTTGGSGTHADWNLNVAGNAGSQGPAGATGAQGPAGAAGAQGNAGPTGSQGPQGPAGAQGTTGSAGPAGPGYGATSTSSLTIGSGSMTFATQSGLAYSTGARARASSAANSANYMEGLVTSYSGTSLIINVDTTGGSGTHVDWNLNVGGNVGPQGPAGAAGSQGPSGAAGAQGPSGATGAQGPAGATGAQGPAGATGAAGSNGTGAAPTGIPLSFSGGHTSINSTAFYFNPSNSTQSGSLVSENTVSTPALCTPSMTIWSFLPAGVGNPVTWNLNLVTPSNATDTWTVGSAVTSCTTAGSSGAAVKCTATAGSQTAANSVFVMTISSFTANGTAYGFNKAFSCQ